MHCGCEFENNKQIKECRYHAKMWNVKRGTLVLSCCATIERVMKNTYLYEIKDELIKEVTKLAK